MQMRCGERKLTLPRNAIIELAAFTEPEPQRPSQQKTARKSANWVLGSTPFQNQLVPVISLEMLIDRQQRYDPSRARLCFMQAITTAFKPAIYAVVCQGFPSLIEIPGLLADSLAAQPAPQNPDQDNPYIAAQIQLGGYLSAVPCLPAIEAAIAKQITPDY